MLQPHREPGSHDGTTPRPHIQERGRAHSACAQKTTQRSAGVSCPWGKQGAQARSQADAAGAAARGRPARQPLRSCPRTTAGARHRAPPTFIQAKEARLHDGAAVQHNLHCPSRHAAHPVRLLGQERHPRRGVLDERLMHLQPCARVCVCAGACARVRVCVCARACVCARVRACTATAGATGCLAAPLHSPMGGGPWHGGGEGEGRQRRGPTEVHRLGPSLAPYTATAGQRI
jgi:hypothetical protein